MSEDPRRVYRTADLPEEDVERITREIDKYFARKPDPKPKPLFEEGWKCPRIDDLPRY